jgi:hypothetical protein
MKIHPGHPTQGIALVAAMIAISVLTFLAAIFWYSMKVESQLAHNGNSERTMYWLGISGVERARWIRALEDGIPRQTYSRGDQFWACGQCSIPESNSVFASMSLDNYPVGENGFVDTHFEDLERKMNINTATSMQLRQALTLQGVDASQISVVSDSILDWINTGDVAGAAGAKSDYYQGLTPPYFAKNAPIDDMSELLLVKGITEDPAIYWGSSESDASHPKLGFGSAPGQEHNYLFGLKDIFTQFSGGKVNLYTTDTNMLAILGLDTPTIETFMQQRDSFPPPNISQLRLSPQVAAQTTMRSITYKVTVTVRYGGSQARDYVAVLLDNSPRDIQVVSFYPAD